MLLWKLWKWWSRRRAAQKAAQEPPTQKQASVEPVRRRGLQKTGNPLPKLFVATLKMVLRDRRTVIWSLAVPVLFAVLFGVQDFGATKHVKVTAVPVADTAFAKRVLHSLEADKTFRVTVRSDFGAARKKLVDGKGDVVLKIPASERGPLTVYYKPDNGNRDFSLGSLQRFVDALNLRLAGVTTPSVRLAERSVEAKDTDYYDFLLPGLIAWGVLNLSVLGMAIAVARFREQSILKRILATPLAPGKFLLAQVGARLLLALGQAAALLVVAVGGFNAHVHGDPVWIFVYVALGNLVFLNIGFAIAGRARNTDSAQAMAQIVSLPMIFLSGVFFPTSGLPAGVSQLVHALPLTPLTTALRKIMLDGDSFTKTAPQLGLLAAWVVVSFVLAAWSFRFDESRPARRLLLRPGLRPA